MDLKNIMAILLAYSVVTAQPPIQYWHDEVVLHGLPQQIYVLKVDPSNPNISIKNTLSKDKIYGFETTGSMAARYDALAAVNGMFYNDLGQHIGGLIMEGQVESYPDPLTPMVAIQKNREIFFGDLSIQKHIQSAGIQWIINGINRKGEEGENILYTPLYGTTNRIYDPTANLVLDGKGIKKIQKTDDSPRNIPENGAVISHIIQDDEEGIPFQEGKEYSITTDITPKLEGIEEAFQSGGWIVRDGKIIVKEQETLIGLTTNREPRTLLGITEDQQLLFIVVDGRQKGYSIGLSGREAGELLLQYGCTDGVFLDGGASSTMIVEGQLVNRPSFRLEERKIAHSITIQYNEEYKK